MLCDQSTAVVVRVCHIHDCMMLAARLHAGSRPHETVSRYRHNSSLVQTWKVRSYQGQDPQGMALAFLHARPACTSLGIINLIIRL
jgi:hypothetical protein